MRDKCLNFQENKIEALKKIYFFARFYLFFSKSGEGNIQEFQWVLLH